MKDRMDWDYVETELCQVGLKAFLHHMENLRIFGLKKGKTVRSMITDKLMVDNLEFMGLWKTIGFKNVALPIKSVDGD